MQTALLTKDGFVVTDRDRPVLGAEQVLVKTIGCGVCGGDLQQFRDRQDLGDQATLLGHEGTGTVEAVGESVTGFKVGDTVTSLEGAYADYFVTTTDMLLRVPEAVDPLHALGEPVACCVHAANRYGDIQGKSAAVVGCGFMGLICLQLLKIAGASEIVAYDPLASRREMAKSLGATATEDPTSAPPFDADVGRFDLVVEAAGNQAALDFSVESVKQHGRLVIIGYHESNGGQRLVDMKLWNFKAIDVVNGHVRRMDEKLDAMKQGLDLIAAGELHTEPLVSLYALENVSQAFSDFADSKEGLFKAVLVPDVDTQ